jgi:hypothetical protein
MYYTFMCAHIYAILLSSRTYFPTSGRGLIPIRGKGKGNKGMPFIATAGGSRILGLSMFESSNCCEHSGFTILEQDRCRKTEQENGALPCPPVIVETCL